MATNQGMYYYTKEEIDELNTEQFTYSTTEKVAGTWIDGSTIYKKTIEFGSLPNNTTKSVAHGISNLSQIVRIEGYAFGSTGGGITPLPYASVSEIIYNITLTAGTTNVSIHTGTNRTDLTGYVTLYYTKVQEASE